MSQEKCGCLLSDMTETGEVVDPYIIYCPLHQAAEELLEACQALLQEAQECDGHGHAKSAEAIAMQAIAHATRKEA